MKRMPEDVTALANLLTVVGNQVSFADAQSLTATQLLLACTRPGIGDPTTGFLAAYTTAKD